MNSSTKRQALIDYLSNLTDLKQIGRNHICKCPVHQEKTPSFQIYQDSAQGTCFGCGFQGDVFDLYIELNGGSFLDAKKALGFWDDNYSPVKQKPMVALNKKELYLKCRESVIGGKDLHVIVGEKRTKAVDFLWDCMKDNPNRQLFIYQICLAMKNDNDSYLFYQYFLSRIEEEDEDYWDEVHNDVLEAV